MAGVALVHGTIRSAERLTRRTDGSEYASRVFVLTKFGPVLGDTLSVRVFDPREGRAAVDLTEGRTVFWLVSVEWSKQFGLTLRLTRELTPSDVASVATLETIAASQPPLTKLPDVSIEAQLLSRRSAQPEPANV